MSGNPDSLIRENFACGIWNPGLWNSEYSLRNLESHKRLESRIQVPLTKTGINYLESGIHGPESKTFLYSLDTWGEVQI